jgi:2-polyprenyl-6-methoxyphenol hydroxylase-like FAD-dependent oxidoreductase
MTEQTLSCRCCIAGGGPAGMMLGLLLARAGVDTIVLEKHADFLRDFRGDTIHPSTLEAINDLGFYDEFLRLPHQKAAHLEAKVGDETVKVADFSHLPTRAKFVAMMPQWDFLNFLAKKAQAYPNFRLSMRAEVDGLIETDGRVAGVTAKIHDGETESPLRVMADLTIAADGRHSTLREKAGFTSLDIGAPMDVLWFRLSRSAGDPTESFGRMDYGQMLALINRGEHWQCGYVIAKGSLESLKAADISNLRERITLLAPFLSERTGEIQSWGDVKLLTVAVDRLPLWHKPGLLCIGDAAHAMSPVGGVGVNLAVQDAIATANILVGRLLRPGVIDDAALAEVQARREFPTKVTQSIQLFVQKRVISGVLGSGAVKLRPPFVVRLFNYVPFLRRIPAAVIGLGIRPERVTAPELNPFK